MDASEARYSVVVDEESLGAGDTLMPVNELTDDLETGGVAHLVGGEHQVDTGEEITRQAVEEQRRVALTNQPHRVLTVFSSATEIVRIVEHRSRGCDGDCCAGR